MKRDVPFVANTKDDLHCMPAVWLMIVKFFKPNMEIDLEKISQETGFEPDKGSWPLEGLLWLKSLGFDVKQIEEFEYEKFIDKKEKYLLEKYPGEAGEYSVKNTNINLETKRAKKLLDSQSLVDKIPTQNDIKRFLDDGYLVRLTVNYRSLNNKKGYYGHAVLVIGHDKNGFVIHDPGLPPMKNRRVGFEQLEKAWADPTEDTKELTAVKI